MSGVDREKSNWVKQQQERFSLGFKKKFVTVGLLKHGAGLCEAVAQASHH